MTILDIIQSSIEILIAALLITGFIFEKRLIIFEKRVVRRIKRYLRHSRRKRIIQTSHTPSQYQRRRMAKAKNAA